MGTRNGAQIRSHAQKYFNKIEKGRGAANTAKSVSHEVAESQIPANRLAEPQPYEIAVPILPSHIETAPPFLPPRWHETDVELAKHKEVTDSFLRILTKLRAEQEKGPLSDIILTQSDNILHKLHDRIYELLPSIGQVRHLYESWHAIKTNIENSYNVIKTISPALEDEKCFVHLSKIMYNCSLTAFIGMCAMG